MTTHIICQNSMTGAIHVVKRNLTETDPKYGCNFTSCGYCCSSFERQTNPNLKKRNIKVCVKCHKSLLKSHNKNLIAHISYLKLKGDINGRIKI